VPSGSTSDTASGFVDRAGSITKVKCPGCGSDHPRRVERKGFLQKKILPMFGYYPWLCGACKTNFLVRKRYRRKSQRKEYVE